MEGHRARRNFRRKAECMQTFLTGAGIRKGIQWFLCESCGSTQGDNLLCEEESEATALLAECTASGTEGGLLRLDPLVLLSILPLGYWKERGVTIKVVFLKILFMALVTFLSQKTQNKRGPWLYHIKLLEKWHVCMGNLHGDDNGLLIWKLSVFIHLSGLPKWHQW